MSDDDDILRKVAAEYNRAVGRAIITSVDHGEGTVTLGPLGGLPSWEEYPPGTFFGVDRSPSDQVDAWMREYKCEWVPTLRERIAGAWRGMVRGWRGGQ